MAELTDPLRCKPNSLNEHRLFIAICCIEEHFKQTLFSEQSFYCQTYICLSKFYSDILNSIYSRLLYIFI